MYKKIVCLVVSLFLSLSILPNMPLNANASVLYGDYILIINTNTNLSNVQSTGTIIFDTNATPVTNSAGQGIPNEYPVLSQLSTYEKNESPLINKEYYLNDVKVIKDKEYHLVGIGNQCYIRSSETIGNPLFRKQFFRQSHFRFRRGIPANRTSGGSRFTGS